MPEEMFVNLRQSSPHLQFTPYSGEKRMRSLVIAAILLSSSVVALFAKEQTRTFVFGQLNVESQKSSGSEIAGSPHELDKVPEPTVILESKSNKYGSYNIAEGTQGPFWSAQGIWNSSTKKYTG